MTRTLRLPFAPGHRWEINNHFADGATRYLYTGMDGDTEVGGHEGIDWPCPPGTPIYAMAAGKAFDVVAGEATCIQRPDYAYGNRIRILSQEARGDYRLTYGHLAAVLVRDGAAVQAGDLIGVSGNSGRSTGAHLHVHYQELTAKGCLLRNNRFGGATDFAHWLDAADKARRAVQPTNLKVYVRAKAGARAAVYGAPNARAYYQAPLQPGQLYPLLGRNRTPWILNPRRTLDEARVYVLDWWQIDVPEYPVAWVIRD